MNIERAALQGKLAAERDARKNLEIRIRAACESIRPKLNCDLVGDLTELEIPDAATLMDGLEALYAELLATVANISRLEKALR